MTAGREEYDLAAVSSTRRSATSPASATGRRCCATSSGPRCSRSSAEFADGMRRMRAHLEQVEKLRNEFQRQSWFVDAVEIYCEAVRSFAEELVQCEVSSRGLQGLRDYLAEYVASGLFASLAVETEAVKQAITGIRYRVKIQGLRVTVSRYAGDADYSERVLETFARFRQGAVEELPGEADRFRRDEPGRGANPRLRRQASPRRVRAARRVLRAPPRLPRRDDREVRPRGAVLRGLSRADRPHAQGDLPFCYPPVSTDDQGLVAVGDVRHRAGEQAGARAPGGRPQRLPARRGRTDIRRQRAQQRRQDDVRAHLRSAAPPRRPGSDGPRPRGAGVPARLASTPTSRRRRTSRPSAASSRTSWSGSTRSSSRRPRTACW